MNKKTKVLATSIATIAMTASLAVGGTYALFTSEDKVNVAVTSGKVEVLANIVTDSFATSTSLSSYTGTDKFELGGTVAYNTTDGSVTLTNMVPGDKVTFNIDLVNNSNVGIQYRVVMTMDGKLGEALQANATIDGTGYTFSSIGATNWVKAAYGDTTVSINDTAKTDDIQMCIVLPEGVGNDYQEKAANLSVKVEAVQGNATVSNATPVSTQEQLQAAIANGDSEIQLTDDIVLDGPLTFGVNTKIDGDGATITRASSFDGSLLNVGAGVTLEMENVTVDGGAVWENGTGSISTLAATESELNWATAVNKGVQATGNAIVANANSKIVLGEDVVIENNDGAYAINLGTRIGATLEINGAKIQYNSSGAGAIWGGGHIVMNSGSISYNKSTGLAGAIRMVSNCNFTMNGGEVNYNVAATDGGVIWGYGSSTYNLNGGEMAYNTAGGVGGAIYTGTYSVVNMGGTFEMHDNQATNSGAIRFTDHTSFTMTGGKIYNNTVNGADAPISTWNNTMSITGGEIDGVVSYVGGLGLTIGEATINGVIAYDLSTNHNTAYLAEKFNSFKFTVDETNANFAAFNFKPAAGYTYTAGDEAKLVCMNEGYVTYWDTATNTFRLTVDLEGTGTEADPYQVYDKASFELLGKLYGAKYIYAEIDMDKTNNGVIDGMGWSEIKFHGSFDGNGVEIVNLSSSLFKTLGYQNKVETITIENMDVTMNTTTGRALVHNLFNGGETIFKNINIHGYIEGEYNMGSFYRYGTANYDDIGCNYTVSFINAKSDAVIIDRSGNTPGGMFGHPFCGTGHKLTLNMDSNSGYTGTLYSTSGKGNAISAILLNGNIILNGEDMLTADNAYSNVKKISVVKAEKNADGTYSIAKQASVTRMVVMVAAQLDAYDENGNKLPNSSGITMNIGSVTLEDLADSVKVFDKVTSVELVTGTGEYKYELVNGVLKVWCGTSNYQSGTIRLQVAQYDSTGSVVSVGTVDLAVITKA